MVFDDFIAAHENTIFSRTLEFGKKYEREEVQTITSCSVLGQVNTAGSTPAGL